MTIEAEGRKITIDVTDKTIVKAGRQKRPFFDQAAGFSPLKVGDQVVVRITEEDGKKVAHLIRVARAR
ncbi:MAG: hypothetical protein ACE5HN_03925 [Nitrospiria bacterium]